MLTRRKVLALGIASCLSAKLSGCVSLSSLQPNCPINWAPSFLSPVFYGFKDYADPAVRVYYPSLDGSPASAAILSQCERFPLVLFIHGDCSGNPFTQWISLPAQLARSGYVVAVTRFGGALGTGDPAVTAPLRQVHDWMRSTWEFRDRLLPAPRTAVVGHSFGATLAAQLVTEIPVTAFAGLSGTFGQLLDPSAALSKIHVPRCFSGTIQTTLLSVRNSSLPVNHRTRRCGRRSRYPSTESSSKAAITATTCCPAARPDVLNKDTATSCAHWLRIL